eukprot:862487-Rhodomonas_salina.1
MPVPDKANRRKLLLTSATCFLQVMRCRDLRLRRSFDHQNHALFSSMRVCAPSFPRRLRRFQPLSGPFTEAYLKHLLPSVDKTFCELHS